MRTKIKIVSAAGVIAALAAGGSAFTDSNTFTQATNGTNAGYGNVQVSGAVIESVNYTLSTNGQNITAVTFKFRGDMTGDTVALGFGDAAAVAANSVTLANCDTTDAGGSLAVYTGSTPGSQTVGDTAISCAISTVTTITPQRLDVAVTNNALT
jgi:hypothetical protein